MITLISLILVMIFIAACSRSIRKHPIPYYVAAAIIAAAVVFLQMTGLSRTFPDLVYDYIWSLFFRGSISGAMFMTVMWTGALPVRSKRIKHFMPVRGELSILASILGLGHAAANCLPYIRLLSDTSRPVSLVTAAFICVSIVMVIIMLPLFVTSFKTIRRKMKSSNWKKLQRLAYVFYALMFIHVSLLYVPYIINGQNYWLSYIIYCFVFVSYGICRIFKSILKNVNIKMLKIQIAGNVLAVVITALCCIIIFGAEKIKASETAKAVSSAQTQASVETEDETTQALPQKESQEETTLQETKEAATTPVASTAETTSAPEDTEETSAQASSFKYNDGTYQGTGAGYEGDITVYVTIENDKMTWIEIGENIEDPEFFTPVLPLIDQVLGSQHTDFDAISGSTYSSYGLLDAIDAALLQAEK